MLSLSLHSLYSPPRHRRTHRTAASPRTTSRRRAGAALTKIASPLKMAAQLRAAAARRLRSGSRSEKRPPEPPSIEPEKLIEMFERYAEEKDGMGLDGLCALCEAVGINPETDVRLLCFCWRVGTTKPSMILREEWNEGMCRLRLDTLEKLTAFVKGEACDPALLDQKPFRDFFKFTFLFSREGTHRTIEKDLVADLLPIACCGRSAHEDSFLKFLAASSTTRVTLDQWCSFLEFSAKVGAAPGFEGYEEDSAWPLLLDEYVEQAQADAKL